LWRMLTRRGHRSPECPDVLWMEPGINIQFVVKCQDDASGQLALHTALVDANLTAPMTASQRADALGQLNEDKVA